MTEKPKPSTIVQAMKAFQLDPRTLVEPFCQPPTRRFFDTYRGHRPLPLEDIAVPITCRIPRCKNDPVNGVWCERHHNLLLSLDRFWWRSYARWAPPWDRTLRVTVEHVFCRCDTEMLRDLSRRIEQAMGSDLV